MSKKDNNESVTFEEAVDQLENIISQMESGEVALADMVDNYEKGTSLLSVCQKRLQEAEFKIQKIKNTNLGVKAESFELDSE